MALMPVVRPRPADYGLGVARAMVGGALAFGAWPAVDSGVAFAVLVERVAPSADAAAVIAQFVAGLLIVPGLATRLAAVAAMASIIVTTAGVDPAQTAAAAAMLMLLAALSLRGPGRLSVDGEIMAFRARPAGDPLAGLARPAPRDASPVPLHAQEA